MVESARSRQPFIGEVEMLAIRTLLLFALAARELVQIVNPKNR
jgi:hypothetical protein